MPSRIIVLLKVLVALTALAVIIAIVFPFFATARECAHCGTNCASNMKQLGLGLAQYEQDNGGAMPNVSGPGGDWRAALFPYVKSKGLYQCPDRQRDDHTENPTGTDGFAQDYAANDNAEGALGKAGPKPVVLADVPHPADLIALMETAYNATSRYDIDDAAQFGPGSKRLWAGHEGRSSYLFLDDHVKFLRPQDTARAWYRNQDQPLSANGVAVLQDAEQRFPGQ